MIDNLRTVEWVTTPKNIFTKCPVPETGEKIAVCIYRVRKFKKFLSFCTRRLLLSGTIGLYRKRSRSLYVCLCVGDLSVTASLCTNHEILCLLCVFHVLVVKLEI